MNRLFQIQNDLHEIKTLSSSPKEKGEKKHYAFQKEDPRIIAAKVGWEIIKGAVADQGNIHWDLQRMEGAKYPYDQKDKYGNIGIWKEKKFRVKQGIENLLHKIEATFEVSFKFNGYSVGYINIDAVNTNDAWGWTMKVEAKITENPNAYKINNVLPIAAANVDFIFRFGIPIVDDDIYIEKYMLCGNGDYYLLESKWTQ